MDFLMRVRSVHFWKNTCGILGYDWSKPEEQIPNNEKIITFYDPAPGLNATYAGLQKQSTY